MSASEFDPTVLPPDLPGPLDDGAAAHLRGAPLPAVELGSSDGRRVRLGDRGRLGRTVVYAYPRTGQPGVAPLSEDWDRIPGARGCTPESCGFRDHHADLEAAGAEVYGLSTQTTDYQREAAQRLSLPFPLLSDAELSLTTMLNLPTFRVGAETLLRRLTLVLRGGAVEHVFYPVFPPDAHAAEVLAWLLAHPLHRGAARRAG